MPDGLLELVDVLVPNQHEAAIIVGRDAPPAELADRLANIAPWAHVIVTAGEDGAYVASANGPGQHITAPRVEALDTTGAGDAFVGALAACMRDGSSVLDAATFAVSAAALSVTRPGTLEGFATREMVAASRGMSVKREESRRLRPTRT